MDYTPLKGTPAETRARLDEVAAHLKAHPDDSRAFALLESYMSSWLHHQACHTWYISGMTEDDIMQELRIIMSRAVQLYRPGTGQGSGLNLLNWVKMCIRSRMISTLKKAGSNRNRVMTEALSMSAISASLGEDDLDINEALADERARMPWEDMSERDDDGDGTGKLAELRGRLSPYEKTALDCLLEDYRSWAPVRYCENAEKLASKHPVGGINPQGTYGRVAAMMSRRMGRPVGLKSVDNVVMRLARKARTGHIPQRHEAFTAERQDQIRSGLAAGQSVTQLAGDIGCSYGKLAMWCRRQGIAIPKYHCQARAKRYAAIGRWLAAGKSRAWIARELGCCYNTVTRDIQVAGIGIGQQVAQDARIGSLSAQTMS